MAESRIAIGILLSLLTASVVHAQAPMPVVKLRQPFVSKASECECAGCIKGKACLCSDLDELSPTVRTVSYTSNCDCGGSNCDACGTEPSCGAAGPSCGVPAPSCGAPAPSCGAAGPSCGAPAPSCGAGACDSAGVGCDSCSDSCTCDSTCDDGGTCRSGCGSGCSKEVIDRACLDLCCKQGFWIRPEALLWWGPENDIPVLATSSALGTPIDDIGVLGLPTTSTLFNDPLFGDARWGGRIRFGTWATDCKHGIDGSIWGLLSEDEQNVWESEGDPALARPFYNVDPLIDGMDSQLVAADGVIRGRLRINTSSEIFGGDLGIRKNLFCCSDVCGCKSTRIDCYAGYRYFKVREGIRVIENLESTSLVGPTVLGTTIDLYDDFQTRNEFNGGTIGMVVSQQYRRLTAEMTSRVSVGNLSREATIDGATTVTVPGLPPVSRTGGLLAQPSNIGTYSDDDFAILPEFQFNLLYNCTCNTQIVFGYTFMWLGDILRPGSIIDPNVNGLALDPTLPVTGPTRPRFDFQDEEMWLMGLNFGVQFSF